MLTLLFLAVRGVKGTLSFFFSFNLLFTPFFLDKVGSEVTSIYLEVSIRLQPFNGSDLFSKIQIVEPELFNLCYY